MFALPFTKAAREKKRLKVILKTTREFIYAHEDLPEFGESNQNMAELRTALAACDGAKCAELLGVLDPPKSFQGCREWLDILVVSISVAMAFRAYFYEPFNIPTGSMQPTLYGNHYEPCDNPGVMQTTPLKWAYWLATGRDYKEFVAPFSGHVTFTERNDGRVDLFVVNAIGDRTGICLPKDALEHLDFGPEVKDNGDVRPIPAGGSHEFVFCSLAGDPEGQRMSAKPISVPAGHRLFRGFDTTGDFLFVNRWLWNFRHPRRGDVMIFATTGISGLQQGTHYIKRMVGTPGETISIRAPKLYVNGEEVSEPRRIGQISRQEKFHPAAYPYAGFRPSGDPRFATRGRTLPSEGSEVALGPDEYFACGDNSPSSYDSRFWGPVPARNLCGIAGGVFWPFGNHRWGPIE